jgi:hypothetical protein
MWTRAVVLSVPAIAFVIRLIYGVALPDVEGEFLVGGLSGAADRVRF